MPARNMDRKNNMAYTGGMSNWENAAGIDTNNTSRPETRKMCYKCNMVEMIMFFHYARIILANNSYRKLNFILHGF